MLTCGFVSGRDVNYLSYRKDSPKDYSFVALLNFNQVYILFVLSWQRVRNISGPSFMRY